MISFFSDAGIFYNYVFTSVSPFHLNLLYSYCTCLFGVAFSLFLYISHHFLVFFPVLFFMKIMILVGEISD
jgi:hypothetical protein